MDYGQTEGSFGYCKQHHPNPELIRGGVCSSCLREKLSKLHTTAPSSSSSVRFEFDYSPKAIIRWSSLSSSSSSPPHRSSKESGGGSKKHGRLSSFKNGLKKSRSSGFATTRSGGGWGSKKHGFWSKLFHKKEHQ
ncbi:DUF740 domain-containing protein [Senna tora]|uniref:DUF740 domain-containing protein n=1 Tax=Senna tora TaxID=362788 RepID=A0A834X7S7_9FABA|nr:DUF740 domain-containing protein [Senna tora]